jgi:hypothetical protein
LLYTGGFPGYNPSNEEQPDRAHDPVQYRIMIYGASNTRFAIAIHDVLLQFRQLFGMFINFYSRGLRFQLVCPGFTPPKFSASNSARAMLLFVLKTVGFSPT